MVAVTGIFLARLWHMQLIEGEIYDEKSRHNRVRLIRLPPSRGNILDMKGRVLAEDRPSFTFSIVPAELENPRELVESCSSVLGIPEERMRTLVERSRSAPRFMNFPLKKNMSLEEVSLVRSRSAGLKGVLLEVKPMRLYPF